MVELEGRSESDLKSSGCKGSHDSGLCLGVVQGFLGVCREFRGFALRELR